MILVLSPGGSPGPEGLLPAQHSARPDPKTTCARCQARFPGRRQGLLSARHVLHGHLVTEPVNCPYATSDEDSSSGHSRNEFLALTTAINTARQGRRASSQARSELDLPRGPQGSTSSSGTRTTWQCMEALNVLSVGKLLVFVTQKKVLLADRGIQTDSVAETPGMARRG